MAKKIALYRGNNPILGSDGLALVDGRLNLRSTISYLKDRNKRVRKNFPHIVCDGFAYYKNNSIRNGVGEIIKI